MKTRYIIPALLAFVAVIGLILNIPTFSGSEEDWTELDDSMTEIHRAAVMSYDIAVDEQDFVACVAAVSAVSVAVAVDDSLESARDGDCRIPTVILSIDECTDFPNDDLSGAQVPAIVEVAIAPVLSVTASLIDSSQDEKLKAWSRGVLSWLEGGKSSVIALIEDPSMGEATIEGVVIEGCTVRF